MHHMHPRSRATGTLFTATLAVCFLVVGLPHVLPCPVDRRKFADSGETLDGKPRRRRKRSGAATPNATAGIEQPQSTAAMEEDGDLRRQRECPVPKPGGLVGQIMGFAQKEREKPVEVVVKSLRSRSGKEGTP